MSDPGTPVPTVVAGCCGRMGRTLLGLIEQDPGFELVGVLEHPDFPRLGSPLGAVVEEVSVELPIVSDPASVLEPGRVLLDFTRPEATRTFLEALPSTGAKMVIGTTGLTEEDIRTIEHVSEETAVLQAPNMSVGVNLLVNLVEEATRCLGEEFDVEVLEMHHRFKEDAPSGTANLLAQTVARARHQNLDSVKKIGREGFEGERDPEEIGISSLRGGDVAGDHTVVFAGVGERLELTHRASSRETFARGALRAAKFLHTKSRGLFSMKDVLGL